METRHSVYRVITARLMGQYCFARWRLLSVVVCNAAGRRAVRPPGTWAVGLPTLPSVPVRLGPVSATPCFGGEFPAICNHHGVMAA